MMAVMQTVLAAALFLLAQDPAAKKPAGSVDRPYLQDRSEGQGEILGCSGPGRLKVRGKDPGRPLEIGIEGLARLRFPSDETRPQAPAGEQVRLAGGGLIGGRLTSFDGEVAVVESGAGPLKVRRRDLKAILLG